MPHTRVNPLAGFEPKGSVTGRFKSLRMGRVPVLSGQTSPSRAMLYSRLVGSTDTWLSYVVYSITVWTPRERQRFAVWCAVRMVKVRHAHGVFLKEKDTDNLLRAITTCRTLSAP